MGGTGKVIIIIILPCKCILVSSLGQFPAFQCYTLQSRKTVISWEWGLGTRLSVYSIAIFCLPCRLYKSLGDFDSLCGIFSSQIGTKAITSDALEAEERGDYQRALQLYKEVCFRSVQNGHACGNYLIS